ncbi:MAG: deoxyguanosinetriphosphate triphosphohydrolase [Verrucomicrobiales bacterium]|nr:deoxyguanosinetriphosphate triphosphohydrolase [Verrucomicrobiales bacterium]
MGSVGRRTGPIRLRSRETLEQEEHEFLAPYAQFSRDTRGRRHSETAPEWRTQFQRDRDRIIHSRGFRRLEYKTQVFLNGSGDHLRTRLTHTIEVAAIARNIARALRLNEDLTEAIALAHDLGHPPFGHTGEEVLNVLLADHGGFEHNLQSLRVVDELERKYPRFRGLNLSWEVREGLLKHRTAISDPATLAGFPFPCRSLEAQVANLADEIAYYSHDLDDGLETGLLQEENLAREVRAWKRAADQVRSQHGRLPNECRRYFTVRCLIDDQVRDVAETTARRIRRAGVRSADDVRSQAENLVQYSPERRRLNQQLRRYLYARLYYNPEVNQPNRRAAGMLEALFARYLANPREMGDSAARRRARKEPCRAVGDYISGMTDRFATLEYERLVGPSPTVKHRGKSGV